MGNMVPVSIGKVPWQVHYHLSPWQHGTSQHGMFLAGFSVTWQSHRLNMVPFRMWKVAWQVHYHLSPWQLLAGFAIPVNIIVTYQSAWQRFQDYGLPFTVNFLETNNYTTLTFKRYLTLLVQISNRSVLRQHVALFKVREPKEIFNHTFYMSRVNNPLMMVSSHHWIVHIIYHIRIHNYYYNLTPWISITVLWCHGLGWYYRIWYVSCGMSITCVMVFLPHSIVFDINL